MTIYGWVILAVISAIVLIAAGIWFIRSFYRRSSKEIAFVRTGLGGQKVVIDSAAYVFPIFHDVTEVYLSTLRLSVTRENEKALISKDRMRVDVAERPQSKAQLQSQGPHARGRSCGFLHSRPQRA